MWEIKGENPGGQLIRVCLDQNQSPNCSLLISGSCQTVLETLNTWFTEGASSERNRGSFFHIALILSVAGLCQCRSHPVSPEVDSCLDRDHRGYTLRCLRCQGNSRRAQDQLFSTNCIHSGIPGTQRASSDYREKSPSGSVQLTLAQGTNSDFSGKGRTLIRVKSSESLFTWIYKTMCLLAVESRMQLVCNLDDLDIREAGASEEAWQKSPAE